MPASYTPLLGLVLPVQGEETNQWGNLVNTALTSLVDTAVAGTTTISTDANVLLTSSTGIADQARAATLLFSGARTAIRTVTAPARSKVYVLLNQTTGGFAVQFVGAGPTTGVTVPNGAGVLVAWNGSDFQVISSVPINLATQVTGTLGLANGGTNGTTAATARTGIGATTVGGNLFTLTNPSAITFPRFNADNSVSALDAATYRTAIGAGTVTSVAASVPAFLSIAGSPITGSGTLAITLSGSALPVANGGTGATALAGASIATYTGAETLTNKRINPRVSTNTTTATLTPDISTFDQYNLTAQTGTLNVAAPTGSPQDGNKLILRILGSGTNQNITWNATYTPIGFTLPATTIVSKTIYVGCVYNSNSPARWDVIALAVQA